MTRDAKLTAALEAHSEAVETYRTELARYIVVGDLADGLRSPELPLDAAGLARLAELHELMDETERAYVAAAAYDG
jgi:hypothetical protein